MSEIKKFDGPPFVIEVAEAFAEASRTEKLIEGLRAGLACAEACSLNTTYHTRVMKEALALVLPIKAADVGHRCIACGKEHTGCCGQCPDYKPLTA